MKWDIKEHSIDLVLCLNMIHSLCLKSNEVGLTGICLNIQHCESTVQSKSIVPLRNICRPMQ